MMVEVATMNGIAFDKLDNQERSSEDVRVVRHPLCGAREVWVRYIKRGQALRHPAREAQQTDGIVLPNSTR